MLIRITNLRLLPGGVLKPPPKQSDDLVVRNHFSMKWSLLYLLDYQLSFNFHKNLIRLIIQIILNKISILYHLDYSSLKRLIIWIIINKILLLYNLDYILINKNLRRLNIWMTFFRETNAFPSRLENIRLTLTRQTGLVVVKMVMMFTIMMMVTIMMVIDLKRWWSR